MIGCNIEDWSATDGLIFRIGSIGSFYNTKWDTLGSGTYRAVKFNYLDVGYSGIFDAESGFLLNGTAAWTNSLPVHSYNRRSFRSAAMKSQVITIRTLAQPSVCPRSRI